MDPNVPPPPKIDRLLALLERYLTPKGSGLPGGTATQADVDAAQKDSPDKGEPVGPGPWPTFEETPSSSSPAPKG
ncbi:benzoate 4-monooxygenase cytochrome P450 [Fusarium circinatum]|uniref:Benzoate 4-monooxygenase cytochrome P450 n=1 Tax=Fusarium circinatum TaxID=48490 RepID=A0A8H5UJ33_FUSCI|nr:benzoate 4-monooxygenase cytochrome P450 [Fusarium circinatum]